MLCSDCKKNQAVIYINKIEKDSVDGKPVETIGLCLQCARKRGVDPFSQIASSMKNMSPEEIEKMTGSFENILANMDMDKLSNMFGGMDGFPEEFGFDSAMDFMGQEVEEDEETSKVKQGTKVKTKEKKSNKKMKYLDTYGTNLTKLAREGKLDKVIGRKEELERLIQILNRRIKNNPALIGEPGVGKTAVINALALKIAEKDVPQKLMNKEVYRICKKR